MGGALCSRFALHLWVLLFCRLCMAAYDSARRGYVCLCCSGILDCWSCFVGFQFLQIMKALSFYGLVLEGNKKLSFRFIRDLD